MFEFSGPVQHAVLYISALVVGIVIGVTTTTKYNYEKDRKRKMTLKVSDILPDFEEILKYCKHNPDTTIEEVADKFNTTQEGIITILRKSRSIGSIMD